MVKETKPCYAFYEVVDDFTARRGVYCDEHLRLARDDLVLAEVLADPLHTMPRAIDIGHLCTTHLIELTGSPPGGGRRGPETLTLSSAAFPD